MERSQIMARVRSADTGPERRLRRLLWGLGYRYRLQAAQLPGTPDLVFPGRKIALFVHGCFWHGHDCRRGARAPQDNAEYWRAKIARNRARDQAATAALTALGWRTLVVWECMLKKRDEAALIAWLTEALGPAAAAARATSAAAWKPPTELLSSPDAVPGKSRG